MALGELEVQHLSDHDPEDPVEFPDALEVDDVGVVAQLMPHFWERDDDQVQYGNP